MELVIVAVIIVFGYDYEQFLIIDDEDSIYERLKNIIGFFIIGYLDY